jgi:glucose-6-phosphate 1-dehydrogenase
MAEDFDVAGRGSFYDAVGTVRDVVQNHLLQVLAYLLMDPPLSVDADDQRDAKHRLLRAVRTVDPAEVVRGSLRRLPHDPGRRGGVHDRDLCRADPARRRLALGRRSRLHPCGQGPAEHAARRGRRDAAATSGDVHRSRGPAAAGPGPPADAARCRCHLHDAGEAARVGERAGAGPVTVDFGQVLGPVQAAYERIFADALRGDPSHFARMDNLEQAWRIAGPILDARTPPDPYALGSWGPAAAATLPGAQGWVELPPPGTATH